MNVSSRFRCAGVLFMLLLASASTLWAAEGPVAWPEYRGPWHNGHVNAPGTAEPIGLPLQWSETQNVVWKTPIPLRGWSTPAVMDGKIWLTTATEDGKEFFVYAVDAATGKILVNKKLFDCAAPDPLGNEVNSYASSSPVVESGRVYVHFGRYGTACLDAKDGAVLWQRDDMPCNHYRGPGSSPFLYENLLVLTFDGSDQQYVTALDKTTGKTVWKTPRSTAWTDLDESGKPIREGDYRKSFCTPIAIDYKGQPQLICLGAEGAFSYEPRTGKELWKTKHKGHSSSTRPLYENDTLYLTTGHGQVELWTLRPDGTGDVTETHVGWKFTGKGIPLEPSMILEQGLLYMLSNDGQVSCLDAANGTVIWSERIGGNYMASLILGDGRLYCPSNMGKMTVLKAGRTFEALATNTLDDGFMASPAVCGKALILRTKSHLYRIEEAAAKK